MLDLTAMLLALAAVVVVAVAAWMMSAVRRDVSIVDSLWSLMILLALIVYLVLLDMPGPRSTWVTVFVSAWALRLAAYITVRNHGQPEDRRYQEIRRRNEPRFWLNSLYLVFLLQGFLAWVICLPAFAAVSGSAPPGPLDYAGAGLWLTGMFFEVTGDYQLARSLRANPSTGEVFDRGLWRYTRHPNYFGEALVWWGVYLFAASAGAWWTVVAPALMTFLLLRVSGVALLEKDIGERRPAYRDYVRRTNAFFPWIPRAPAAGSEAAR